MFTLNQSASIALIYVGRRETERVSTISSLRILPHEAHVNGPYQLQTAYSVPLSVGNVSASYLRGIRMFRGTCHSVTIASPCHTYISCTCRPRAACLLRECSVVYTGLYGLVYRLTAANTRDKQSSLISYKIPGTVCTNMCKRGANPGCLMNVAELVVVNQERCCP